MTKKAKFFKKVSNVTKPQLKIIPYIILGMIEAIREVIKNYKINKKEIHITWTICIVEMILQY